jgi:hypothetical protein
MAGRKLPRYCDDLGFKNPRLTRLHHSLTIMQYPEVDDAADRAKAVKQSRGYL